MKIEEIKQRFDCHDILAQFLVKRSGQNYHCPFHEDKQPSFSVFADGQKWKCFSCGAVGDQIDLYAQLSGVSNAEALKMLSSNTDEKPVKKISAAAKSKKPEEDKPKKSEADLIASFREQWENREKARAYVEGRKVNFDKVKENLGWQENVLGSGHDCVTIPMRDQNQHIIGIQRRSTKEHKFFMEGNSGLFYKKAEPGGDALFICEGVFDFLTLRQYSEDVLGFASAATLPACEKIVKKYRKIFWLGDQNEAGEKLKAKFLAVFGDMAFYQLFKLGENEDVNTVFSGAKYESDSEFVEFVKSCCSPRPDSELTVAEDHVQEIMREMRDKTNRPFTWGGRERDLELGILERGQYNVFMGEPGAGKTEFCFYLARVNAERGSKVLFISLEMNTKDLLRRYAEFKAGVTKEERIDVNIHPAKIERVSEILKEIPKNIEFMGGKSLLVEQIEKKIRSRQYDLVFVDNFGFLETKGTDRERYESISRELVNLKKDMNCCIITLHHFRKGEKKVRGTDRSLHDIRGSAKIGDDTDLVIHYLRPDVDEYSTPEDRAACMVRILKNRKEGVGYCMFPLYFKNGMFYDSFQS